MFPLTFSSNLFQSFNILSYSFTTSQLIQTQKVPQVHISVIHNVTIGMSVDMHVTNSMTFPQAGQYHCAKTVSFFLTKYCKTVCQMCHKNLCSLLLNIGQSNFPSLNHNTNTMYIAFFIYPAFLYRREQQFMCIDFWGLWWKPCNWIICQIKSTVCYIHCTRHNHKVYKQNSYCITCS